MFSKDELFITQCALEQLILQCPSFAGEKTRTLLDKVRTELAKWHTSDPNPCVDTSCINR